MRSRHDLTRQRDLPSRAHSAVDSPQDDVANEASLIAAPFVRERNPQMPIVSTIKCFLGRSAKIPCKIRGNLSFGQRIAPLVTIPVRTLVTIPKLRGGLRNPRIRHVVQCMKILLCRAANSDHVHGPVSDVPPWAGVRS
jgi:hypothetical protein